MYTDYMSVYDNYTQLKTCWAIGGLQSTWVSNLKGQVWGHVQIKGKSIKKRIQFISMIWKTISKEKK